MLYKQKGIFLLYILFFNFGEMKKKTTKMKKEWRSMSGIGLFGWIKNRKKSVHFASYNKLAVKMLEKKSLITFETSFGVCDSN